MLTETHHKMLTGESGISEEVIRQRGYRSVTDAAELRGLGFAPAQCRPPGLLLPLWPPDGGTPDGGPGYVFRPDNPRVVDERRRGKLPDGTYRQRVIKYEQPQGEGTRLDCPPVCRPALADPAAPLFITEGQKKADALASRGACAVALLGVWNFKGRNDFGGVTLLADFDYIALRNRPVYLVFDSDVTAKSGVRAALERLTEHLKRKGAVVHVIYLPPAADGHKQGVDDWLVGTGKGIADLTALAEGPRPEPKAAAPLVALLDLAPNRMTRPLALIDGRAWAATWVWTRTTELESVNRRGEIVRHNPPRVVEAEEMVVMRDDGVVFGRGGDRPLTEAGILVSLPEMIRPEMRLSPAGVRAYREGRRPDPVGVFRRVCACIDRFIDFDRSLADQQTMVEMIACFIMATWFLDAFTVAGNLWPNGDRGSGKTQLLAIVSELAYLGQLVLAGGSFAALRDLADYGATLAFDDAENLSDPRKTDPDKRTLLLAGNRRGNSVPLKEKIENGWRLRYINTFSFRLFSATQLPDPVLSGRTIVVPLIRTPDRYRANADPLDFGMWPHDRQALVDDLWALALAHLPRLAGQAAHINAVSSLTGRNLEPWRALLAVAGWLADAGEAGLLERMMALSVAYQKERSSVEESDLTMLVIRALGLVVGKTVRERLDVSDVSDVSDVYTMSSFFPTSTITAACQAFVEAMELDINPDQVSSRKVGHVLAKMRLPKARQQGTGQKGWMISIADVVRWIKSYGLDLNVLAELNIVPHGLNVTNVTNVTNVKATQPDRWGGEL